MPYAIFLPLNERKGERPARAMTHTTEETGLGSSGDTKSPVDVIHRLCWISRVLDLQKDA
jgi:hypothetical protein